MSPIRFATDRPPAYLIRHAHVKGCHELGLAALSEPAAPRTPAAPRRDYETGTKGVRRSHAVARRALPVRLRLWIERPACADAHTAPDADATAHCDAAAHGNHAARPSNGDASHRRPEAHGNRARDANTHQAPAGTSRDKHADAARDRGRGHSHNCSASDGDNASHRGDEHAVAGAARTPDTGGHDARTADLACAIADRQGYGDATGDQHNPGH